MANKPKGTVINLARKIAVTLDDGSVRHLNPGEQAVDAEVANHAYVQANLVPEEAPKLGSAAYADALHARATELEEAAADARAQAEEAKAAYAAAQAESQAAEEDLPDGGVGEGGGAPEEGAAPAGTPRRSRPKLSP